MAAIETCSSIASIPKRHNTATPESGPQRYHEPSIGSTRIDFEEILVKKNNLKHKVATDCRDIELILSDSFVHFKICYK